MRIAEIATGLAAVVAVPMAMQATRPSMSEGEFVSAVRCAAYEQATAPNADPGNLKYQLNAEARRQPVQAVAVAAAQASAARQAVITGNGAGTAMVDSAASCGAGLIAQGGDESAA